MKYKELKSMSREEIENKLKELKMDLVKSNAQVATGTIPKNPGQLKQTKKAIAKIKQLLSEGTAAKGSKPAKKEAEKLKSKIPNSRNEVSRKTRTEEKKE